MEIMKSKHVKKSQISKVDHVSHEGSCVSSSSHFFLFYFGHVTLENGPLLAIKHDHI